MNIQINIRNTGQAVGTIGWLATHAHHIHIGRCKGSGEPGAWLVDKAGKTMTVLALAGAEFAGIETVTRGVGQWPLSCDIVTTDAAWAIIEQLATIAAEHMAEPEEIAAGYKVSVTAERAA